MKKFAVLFLFILINAGCSDSGASKNKDRFFKDVPPKQAYELILENKENSDFVVLDVRTLQEYQAGHLPGAIRIDFYSENFRAGLGKLDRDKTYLVYCRTSNRSGQAVSMMKEIGFRKVYHLIGGIVAWNGEDLPLER
jgi:rhodanese-related sulfurtransferase